MKKIAALMLSFVLIVSLCSVTAFAMQIFVEDAAHNYMAIEVEPTDRIEDVRAKLFDETGIPVDRQILQFAGTTLEDGNTLQDYSIQKDAIIQLTEKQDGGVAVLTGTVTITGETKFGSELTAIVSDSNNTGTLSYQWFCGGFEIIGVSGATYTLDENDLNKRVTVVVTSSVESGSITSAQTATVEKADCFDIPTGLDGVAPTTEDGYDCKITGTTGAMEYSDVSDFHYATECDEGETISWNPGTYYVRYSETGTHKAGVGYATVIVPGFVAPSTYTVVFDANGGAGEMEDQTLTHGVAQALLPNTFTREGYLFVGWDTEADRGGRPFADEEEVTDLTTEDGGTVILYAQWAVDPAAPQPPVVHSVIFMDGDTLWTETTCIDGDALGIAGMPVPEAPAGYEFDGWYTDDGVIVRHGMIVTEDIVAYAAWKKTGSNNESPGNQFPVWPSNPAPSYPSGDITPVESAKTFDGIAIAVGLSVLSVTGSAWLLRKKED